MSIEEEFDTEDNEEEETEFDLEEYKNAFSFLRSKLQNYQLKLEDIFDFIHSKQCRIKGIIRYKRMSFKQFAPVINQIRIKGILNNSEEVYSNEPQ